MQKHNLIEHLKSRKLLRQSTANVLPENICIYCGFDPTSISLHIGHLIVLRILRIAKDFGCRTIGLIGSATALLGDPTWKTETRPMLDPIQIANNAQAITLQIQKIANPDQVLDNNDWLNINLLDFMRDVAAHFSVNQLVALDTFETRLNSNKHLSFMEFTYPLLQSLDFLHLYRKYRCNVQLGGSDQWGNIVQGLNLIDKVEKKQAFGMTSELLVTSTGVKMGKSMNGAIFLDENLVSPYKMWQFWRNVEDVDVKTFLLQLTDLEKDEIEAMSDIVLAKKTLADHVTELVHGSEKAKSARAESELVFEKNDYSNLDVFTISDAKDLDKVLVAINFAKSVSEAKRAILAGSIKVDDEKIVNASHVLGYGEYIICSGKKRFAKVVIGNKEK